MNITLAISFAAALANLIIAFFILARGLRAKLNIVFFVLVNLMTFWSVSLGVSNTTQNVVLSELSARLTFGFSGLVLAFSYMFVVLLGSRTSEIKDNIIKKILLSTIITPIFFSSLIYTAITINEFSYGPAIIPYVIYLIAAIVLMAIEVRHTLKYGNKLQRTQSKLVAILLAFTIGAVGVLNVLIPAVTGSDKLSNFSPLLSLMFSVVTAYSIIRHRLFDIKGAVARAVTYLITTGILISAYVLLAYALKRIFIPSLSVGGVQLVSNIVLTTILIVAYPYLKRRFDMLTSHIFFRDAYDPQVFLDRVNKSLVGNIDIESLLHSTAGTVEQYMKVQFCSFSINHTNYFSNRLVGKENTLLTDDSMGRIKAFISKSKYKSIYVEDRSFAEDESDFADLLKKYGVQVIVRLKSITDNKVSDVGYMIVGEKRSGNLYSKLDLNILEIVANELVIAVENALRFEEIDQFNVTLQKKITDATKELKKSNEKLKALDEAKDEFISMASHQLRTPLTSVKGYLSMLAEGDAGKLNDTQKKFIDQAFISSQRMVYLIADLLNVSRLKTGKFIIEAHPVFLPDVVESEIAQLSETVKSRGLTMTFDKPKEFAMIDLDETKIRQVIMNFTDNAIYYTPSGGSIKVALIQDASGVEFTVTDTGIGVPKSEQPHLFTKFYRAGNARKARPDGTGLGLFMAKKVVVAQGGSLIFKTSEGKGSTFGFRFNIIRK